MAYASHLGRAKINPRNPRAAAICDKCSFIFNHADLRWQFFYAGAGIQNKRTLVCQTCYDKPNPQLRAVVLPADPVPINNPRIEDWLGAETDQRVTSGLNTVDSHTGIPVQGGNTRVISSAGSPGATRVTQATGMPVGGLSRLQNYQPGAGFSASMPQETTEMTTAKFNVVIPAISITTDGYFTISVTCSSAHKLSAGQTIAVEGGGNALINGFYSVIIVSATSFSYQTSVKVPVPGPRQNNLLQSNTVIRTAFIGVPYGMTGVPQAGY